MSLDIPMLRRRRPVVANPKRPPLRTVEGFKRLHGAPRRISLFAHRDVQLHLDPPGWSWSRPEGFKVPFFEVLRTLKGFPKRIPFWNPWVLKPLGVDVSILTVSYVTFPDSAGLSPKNEARKIYTELRRCWIGGWSGPVAYDIPWKPPWRQMKWWPDKKWKSEKHRWNPVFGRCSKCLFVRELETNVLHGVYDNKNIFCLEKNHENPLFVARKL